MLTKYQEKVIKSLSTKKGREEYGLCLVEGQKVIELAGDFVEYSFGPKDSMRFHQLVTTETPQSHAAVARIPVWDIKDIMKNDIIVLLDSVQDPGNVGTILRLCLGFRAGLLLIESADPLSPKVIRSSVGALFQVPWISIKQKDISGILKKISRPVFRLEKKKEAQDISKTRIHLPIALVAGSEGRGIRKNIKGVSLTIHHHQALESLNVGHALAIALYALRVHP
ncbi:RNA methyltransferase [Candidatus Uhrbacteria bacterium]|nr:RNA methyltransferase [Candidatus Uhrbacteria bacterium]